MVKIELGKHIVCDRCHGKGEIGRKHIRECPKCKGEAVLERPKGT